MIDVLRTPILVFSSVMLTISPVPISTADKLIFLLYSLKGAMILRRVSNPGLVSYKLFLVRGARYFSGNSL